MTAVSLRAHNMLGMVAEYLSDLDHVTLYCENVGMGCTALRLLNPVTTGGSPVTDSLVKAFRCRQARSIDATKGSA